MFIYDPNTGLRMDREQRFQRPPKNWQRECQLRQEWEDQSQTRYVRGLKIPLLSLLLPNRR